MNFSSECMLFANLLELLKIILLVHCRTWSCDDISIKFNDFYGEIESRGNKLEKNKELDDDIVLSIID